MEVENREKLLEKHNILRQDLKKWEREFTSNGGRKPERDDIKKHPAIAQKYKDYNRIRDILAGKETSQASLSPQRPISRKRVNDDASQTPVKRLAVAQTPSKRTSHPADIDPYDSPSLIQNLCTPSKFRIIGPTPQKDGKALGLFDLLSDENQDSPTGKKVLNSTAQKILMATPRKPKDRGEVSPRTSKGPKTPASGRKRFIPDNFMTPFKRQDLNQHAGKTPPSVSKLHFLTPAFLRRDCQRTILSSVAENDDGALMSPEMVKLPKKPLLRGLSSILAGLRKMQSDAADEDLDILREIENEAADVSKFESKGPDIQVNDSQVKLPLSGFDDEGKYDSEPDEVKNPPLDRNQPLKIYKKKGQKRTTRRVVMKPVRSRPPRPASRSGVSPSPSSSPTLQREECIADTQQDDAQEASGLDGGTEYTTSEKGAQYRPRPPGRGKKAVPSEESTTKTKASHVNFKRLKLRNSGMKGAPAHNSRFRRKR